MKTLATTALTAAGLMLATASAQAAVIDFASLGSGTSVFGQDAVAPGLTISSASGDAAGVVLEAGKVPATYGAPNGGSSVLNGGLPATGGFGDISDGRLHDFVFEFDTAVDFFQVRFLDFGDYNPTKATQHLFGVRAWDTVGSTTEATVTYNSTAEINPGRGDPAGLYITGDAVTAAMGDPGDVQFTFDSTRYTKFAFIFETDGISGSPSDPNIAFAELEYSVVPLPAAAWFMLTALGGLAGTRWVKRVRTGS
ncbi:VPLPA-CTERM sorting domain-containing protein [uncultured Rhodospira sp.]|uniref:VPLPA-CTERM sorting domain-containing protein n=1 Tax=uncultured Rhodospira sp. TaxID=1936189 RepID=UPI002603514D|nr:VPLPA-CTERM sorting domain-containing protein [uncultured Rhodospira sp.]